MKLRSRNILTLLQDKTCDYEDRIALGMKSSFGWKELTYKGIGLLSRKLASFLIGRSWKLKKESVLPFCPNQNRNTAYVSLLQCFPAW